MKRFLCILSFLLCAGIAAVAQSAENKAEEQMKQAQTLLQKKEYIKSRYLFLQAYNAFSAQEKYAEAVRCGAQVSTLYHRENYYKEAFEMCRSMEQLVQNAEQKLGKGLPGLRYAINKERLKMYTALKRTAQAKEWLALMEENAKASRSDSIREDMLYTQANYYHTLGMPAQGDAAFNRLINEYKQQQKYERVNECYHTLIGIARRSNNAALVARTYEQFNAWTDSIRALTEQDELNVLKQKYNESLKTISEKDGSLSTKQYIIIGLCLLAAVLAGALIFGGIVLLRFIMLTRRQKKAIRVANEHNEQKTKFIRNISAQMEPTLRTLDASQPGVRALREFAAHIQELSDLENSLTEVYETREVNVGYFCEEILAKITPQVPAGVDIAVNAPKLSVKINPEQLERILLHLLHNAVTYTPEGGKIRLEFKKRGAHTHQFVVSDTGCGIEAEKQEELFKPFTEVKDLTKGDGLGLPICSLIATKMNGSLTLDTTYTKGSRFVLELRS